MKIAQVAPLIESVPPRLYGGTERIVSYLTEELVRLGHDVTLFASGDSITSAELDVMPIIPFLAGQAFDAETIENMSGALAATCDALHLKVGDDPAARIVAEKVIEWAQRGIRDPNMLRKLTLKEFDLSDDTILNQRQSAQL
jgi:hypothetical protein